MSKQFHGCATIFIVNDLARSVAFYRDVLGFNVAFSYGEPPSYAGVERDDVIIHLFDARRAPRQAGQGGIYIFASDVDAIYREFTSRGGVAMGEPGDRPYGMRDFDVKDPDGNWVSFGCESKT